MKRQENTRDGEERGPKKSRAMDDVMLGDDENRRDHRNRRKNIKENEFQHSSVVCRGGLGPPNRPRALIERPYSSFRINHRLISFFELLPIPLHIAPVITTQLEILG